MSDILLPLPSEDNLLEWAESITEIMQSALDSGQIVSSGGGGINGLTFYDTSGRVVLDESGIYAYDALGNIPIAPDIVEIDTAQLVDTAVTTAKIANLSVDNDKLAALAVDAAKLASGSVGDTKLDRTTDPIVIDSVDIATAAITSAKIANAAVGTAAIANAAIGTAQIANLAVTSALIADAAIVNAKIDDLAVNEAKIANLAVSSGKIQNAAITNAKIGSLAVSTAKIASAAITNAKIANLAVDNAKIANATITGAKIANATIDTAQIANAAITNAKIANLAVDTAQIANAAIQEAKIDSLSVSTIKIQNQAVTIPTSAFTAGSTGALTVGSYETVQTITFTSTGVNVYIVGAVGMDNDSGTPNNIDFRIRRGSTTLVEIAGVVLSSAAEQHPVVFPITDTPSAGSVTYTVEVKVGLNNISANNRSLFALETKK